MTEGSTIQSGDIALSLLERIADNPETSFSLINSTVAALHDHAHLAVRSGLNAVFIDRECTTVDRESTKRLDGR
jgi:hypothetical protein